MSRINFLNYDSFPINGLIYAINRRKRLGVWIMPDNNSRGMMETFLSTLVKTDEEGRNLLEYSKKKLSLMQSQLIQRHSWTYTMIRR
ncbi:DUF3226 domain-containing protein [Ferrovum myxofaciens]|uniref:DUF3226 domain-containing protein n=1 Tax=Ferrovum myxofaciens TaxID=416213 RepID=UPI003B5C09C4